jgi:hypothetical protein
MTDKRPKRPFNYLAYTAIIDTLGQRGPRRVAEYLTASVCRMFWEYGLHLPDDTHEVNRKALAKMERRLRR